MTHSFRLERLDGTPADPPARETTELVWNPGDTIPIAPGRTLQVVRIYRDDATGCPCSSLRRGLKSD